MNGHRLDLLQRLDRKISLFKKKEDALNYINSSTSTTPIIISFINAHAFNLCFKDRRFAEAIIGSDIVLRDGVGMEILFRWRKRSPGANMNGTDFIPYLLNSCLGKRIALIGTTDPFLTKAGQNLRRKGHKIVFMQDGFLPIERYLSLIAPHHPEIIVLGMGMPKQEYLSTFLKENLSHPCVIINGGAIIDFLGNKYTRAPLWIRSIKLEWLYRFLNEPKRLFNRYTIGNILFLFKVLDSNVKNNRKEITGQLPFFRQENSDL